MLPTGVAVQVTLSADKVGHGSSLLVSPAIGNYRLQRLFDIFGRDNVFHQVLVHRFLSESSRDSIIRPDAVRLCGSTASAFGTR